jgi:hypothetical protein
MPVILRKKYNAACRLNILDENIIASQRSQLRSWRIHHRHIGTDIGRRGMKDRADVIPLLHHLRHPTFFTHDLGFFDFSLCHERYALVCLGVKARDAATYIRSLLRHPAFRTDKQRLGKVILLRTKDLSYWQVGKRGRQVAAWPKL